MKIKTTTGGYIICIVVIAIFAIAAGLVPPVEESTPISVNFNKEAQAEEVQGNVYEVSCYTGVESHGKNGVTDGVSVATYQFPQGTWVEIEGFGMRRVDTVTSRAYQHRVDIWFGSTEADYQRCLEFGLQYLEIN